ncbi:MAG: cation-translocating P-type ATPase [Phycisphaerales bacterium]|nr:cation-translocating P-type ATPase [Phycisphaerales bacterium]
MHCASCVARVENALRAVAGVADARVNLATNTATLECRDGSGSTQTLLTAVRNAGYDAQRVDSSPLGEPFEPLRDPALRRARQTVVQAIGLAVPVIALDWIGHSLQSSIPGGHVWWRALQALLCVMLLRSSAGAPILVAGLRAIIHRAPNMDLLIALGVTTAFASSVVSIVLPTFHGFHFHAVAMILAFINVGRYLEQRAKRETSSAVAALARRIPRTALRRTNGATETVPTDSLHVGDTILVPPDHTVPVDGRVIDGTAAIDLAAITGESIPVTITIGGTVPAGGIVREGTITLHATAVGRESTIGAILRAVENAQSGKTHMQRIADRFAGVFVPIAVLLASATLIGWGLAGFGWTGGLRAAIAVLVIACPCAMGLATPTAVLVATGSAALRGILVRDAAALESAGRIDTILFDKTGTITTGRPRVESVVHVAAHPSVPDENAMIRLAASTERLSTHPLARAVVDEAARRGIAVAEPESFDSDTGRGVSAGIGELRVSVGNAEFMSRCGIDGAPLAASAAAAPRRAADGLSQRGQTVVFVAVDDVWVGLFGLADAVRPDAAHAVHELKRLGIRTAMVTGDTSRVARSVADQIGIDDVLAGAPPNRKQSEVTNRRDAGHVVAFVGDGVNDAPALAAADVGIAFASGTDVANAAADITLIGSNLTAVPDAVRLARRAIRVIKQNLWWAFVYNLAAIPLAATGHVPPGPAAAAMMLSSISVVLNSLRLRSHAPPGSG